MACTSECIGQIVINTGLTETNVSYIDCNGDLIEFSAVTSSGGTYFVNYCNGSSISGDTITKITPGKGVLDYYNVFISCCNPDQGFLLYSTTSAYPTGTTINLIDSLSYSGNVYTDCFISTEAGSTKTPVPSGYDILSYVGYTTELPLESKPKIYTGCTDCLVDEPCLVDCYKLYSCDGSTNPFYSSDINLSGFVNNYVVLDITSPEILEDKCFYVKYNNFGDCDDSKTFTINYSGVCDCSCDCYTFKTPNEIIGVEYIDCNDLNITRFLPTGQTINICSKIKPIFDYSGEIVLKNNGNCKNNECPQPPITIKPRNECDVLTIFPMDVNCKTVDPSTVDSFDGAALLIITGGTPPYTIEWENGSYGQLLSELNIGEYSATVTDFYGDFVIETTCVLTATTTSTTTTTTTKPPIVYDPLCLEYRERQGKSVVTVQIQFEPHIDINGKPSWTGETDFLLYWTSSKWEITGSTISGSLVNNNPLAPPLVGWTYLGNPNVSDDPIVAYTGTCNTIAQLTLNRIGKNDVDCNNKQGSIIIDAQGGVIPYTYSIDGGNTYPYTSGTITGLNPGTYYVRVKDAIGNESVVTPVTINLIPLATYSLTLSIDQNTNTFTITPDPNLPATQTITFTVAHISTFKTTPVLISGQEYINQVTFNGGLGGMTLQSTNNTTEPFTCGGNPIGREVQQKTYTKALTINGGQVITGTYTDQEINPYPTADCRFVQGTFQLFIQSASCGECCKVGQNNPPLTNEGVSNGIGIFGPKAPSKTP